jgi:hemerythrin-like domain-containing protein
MATTEHAPETLRTLLTRDHQRLDQLFTALLNALRADAREDVLRLWAAFDDGLSLHISLEEEHILPALREQDAALADALTREHQAFRLMLAELGVAVDLHQIRAQTVSDFIDQLRRHASREDAFLYCWADENLSAPEKALLRTRLDTAAFLRQQLAELGRRTKAPQSAVR